MTKTRPVIGITMPDNENFFYFVAIRAAVFMAGGKPLMLSAKRSDYKNAAIDGLILGGGRDVFPGLFNHPPKEEYIYDRERDDMEVFWAERALQENIPVFGICRGAQLMNVVCGGSLHMSVSEAYEDAHYPDGIIHNILYRKTINIPEDTLLYEIMQTASLKVNSIHKQAVSNLGEHMNINAQENNGVIQAIAHTRHPFFLGVQFHPEFLIYRKLFRRLFEALTKAASQRLP